MHLFLWHPHVFNEMHLFLWHPRPSTPHVGTAGKASRQPVTETITSNGEYGRLEHSVTYRPSFVYLKLKVSVALGPSDYLLICCYLNMFFSYVRIQKLILSNILFKFPSLMRLSDLSISLVNVKKRQCYLLCHLTCKILRSAIIGFTNITQSMSKSYE